MINKMHEMYTNDKVTIDILAAVGKYLDKITENIDEIARQRLLNYCTWYLDIIEAELGITEKDSEFTKRCDTVRIKLMTRGKVCVEKVKNMCDNYVSYSKVVYSAEERMIYITLSNDITDGDRARLEGELRDYLPAHILIVYKKYGRTHEELGDYTHEELGAFTHRELREKGVLI